MAQAAVDYDALAAQQGGSAAAVDYDALAQQHGGQTAERPKMTFAIVNGQRVPLDGLPDDIQANLQDHSAQGDALLENIKNIAGVASDVVVGAGKALVKSGVRGGALLRMIPGVDAVANRLPSVSVPDEPSNLAQRLGGMAEQAAEIAAPSRAVAALGEKAAELSAPILSRVLSPTLAQLIPNVAVQATGNVALAKAQGATNTEAAVTGAVAGAVPTIGTTAVALANQLRDSAEGNVYQFFNPTTKAMKAVVAKRTPEILDRGAAVLGTMGRNREGAEAMFTAARQTAGDAIDTALSQFGSETVHDAPQRLMAALDSAKAPYVKTRLVSPDEARGLAKYAVGAPLPDGRIQVAIPLSQKAAQIDKLKAIVKAHGDDMSVDDLVGLRRAWDEIAYAKPGVMLGPSEAAKWSKKMGGDAIRGIIASDHPDLTALNREFSFWKDLETAMSATVDRKVGQVGGLRSEIAQAAGAAAASSAGLGPAIASAKTAKLAQQVFASPRYQSLSAAIKTGLAHAITTADQTGAAAWLKSAALRVGVVEAPRELGEVTE